MGGWVVPGCPGTCHSYSVWRTGILCQRGWLARASPGTSQDSLVTLVYMDNLGLVDIPK